MKQLVHFLHQAQHGAATVADAVFQSGGDFGRGLSVLAHIKMRVVAKAIVTTGGFLPFALPHAIQNNRLRVVV